MSSDQTMYKHKPYPPTVVGLGETPTPGEDDPIIGVFIFLFVLGAITHMTILQVNLRRGQKFIMSGMLFGFCMARIVALSLRLAWASYPHDVSVAIAAQIFVALGTVLIFIINLIFSQRIIRASHPNFGWAKWFSIFIKLVVLALLLVITAYVICTTQSFYTLSHNTKRIDRDVQLFALTFSAFIAFLPTILVVIRIVIPKKAKTETFGTGHFNTKIVILLTASILLTMGASFRSAVAYKPRPAGHPAWYDSKPCFYLFNFTIEWIVVAMYAIIRVDKRFWVPNNAHGPGDYSRGVKGTAESGDISSREASSVFSSSRRGSFAIRVLSEEHVFDEMTPEQEAASLEKSRTRRSSSATTRTWSARASISRAWTRSSTSGDLEAAQGGSVENEVKPEVEPQANKVVSERSTDSE